MIRSLQKTRPNSRIIVVALDQITYEVCKEEKDIITFGLSELELCFPELLKVKSERKLGEYCWTTTPFLIQFVWLKFPGDTAVYVDADLYFFVDPSLILEQMENKSILITPHFYSPEYDQTRSSGTFCVQFLPARHDERAQKVVETWASQCLEWCYARHEPGKFGDQMYLETWPKLYPFVHVLENVDYALAPWNLTSWDHKRGIKGFFHGHGIFNYSCGIYDLGDYRLSNEVIDLIYKPYLQVLRQMALELNSKVPYRVSLGQQPLVSRKTLSRLKSKLLNRVWNIGFQVS